MKAIVCEVKANVDLLPLAVAGTAEVGSFGKEHILLQQREGIA